VTCSECKHFNRCQFLLQRTGEETECDWEPSRFLAEGAIHLDEHNGDGINQAALEHTLRQAGRL
jgi:hypothetical protein